MYILTAKTFTSHTEHERKHTFLSTMCSIWMLKTHTHTHTHMNAYTPFHTDDLLKTAKTTAPTMDEPMAKQQSVKEMRRRKKLKCILIRGK